MPWDIEPIKHIRGNKVHIGEDPFSRCPKDKAWARGGQKSQSSKRGKENIIADIL